MKRVLIVDDAIDLGRLLQDALKTVHPDIPITVVPSAEEALLESTRFTIDLLVTDWRLPGMSGLELIRKIRVRQPNVKVILMTGLSTDERMTKQINEAAPNVFLRKPMMPTTFLDAVEQLFGSSPAPEKMPAEPQAVSAAQSANEAVLKEIAAVLPGEPVQPHPASARKGTGLLVDPAAPVEEGLSGILSRLRGSLGAHTAMLLDERGRPVAQAGDLPDAALGPQLVQPVMSSLSAGAKISYLLGQETALSVQAYRGTNMDLVTCPVGQYVLLIAMRTGRSAMRVALAFEEALNAQAELAAALESMGLRVQSAAEAGAPEVMLAEMGGAPESPEETIPPEILETPLGQDPDLEKFQELFTRKKTGQLNLEDPDDFWDLASNGEKKEVTQPGMLSFEQAQKLGLLPADNE